MLLWALVVAWTGCYAQSINVKVNPNADRAFVQAIPSSTMWAH
jgi:hypothetical protein